MVSGAQDRSPAEFRPLETTLRDGRRVTIRAIRPEDAGHMQAAVARLSDDSRAARFMAPLKELSPAMLERAVRPAPGRDLALVAVAGDAIVGGARYAGATNGSCEFAVAVVDDWQGAGLASRLMRALIGDARARGLERMEGYVLASNHPMLELAQRLGFEVTASEEGPSVKLVRLDLVTKA